MDPASMHSASASQTSISRLLSIRPTLVIHPNITCHATLHDLSCIHLPLVTCQLRFFTQPTPLSPHGLARGSMGSVELAHGRLGLIKCLGRFRTRLTQTGPKPTQTFARTSFERWNSGQWVLAAPLAEPQGRWLASPGRLAP